MYTYYLHINPGLFQSSCYFYRFLFRFEVNSSQLCGVPGAEAGLKQLTKRNTDPMWKQNRILHVLESTRRAF